MSDIRVHGHRCHYQLEGPAGAPVLVLAHALGATLEMWAPQVNDLGERYRLLRYDIRGQGLSERTPGDYDMAMLGRDVLGLVEALELGRFSFCGLSMGGMIGQWLGLHAGHRLERLILCNTAAQIGQREGWNERMASVLRDGMGAVAEAAIGRWFSPAFAAAEPLVVETVRQQLLAADPQGYVANCAAIRDADFSANLPYIRVPTLVIAGRLDAGFPVPAAEAMAAAMPHARLRVLEAAHLSNVEARRTFSYDLEAMLADDLI